jgi:spore coat protein U-like protein
MLFIRKQLSRPLRLLPALLLTLAATSSYSTTATAVISTTATVPALCLVTGTAIAFGNYSSTQLDQSGSIGVVCTNGTTYTVALDAGAGSGATVATRVMTGPSSATLNYTIYSDAARTSVWGQTAGTNTVAGTGNGLLQSLNIYGRIPGSQTPAAGAYTDTITVTLTY